MISQKKLEEALRRRGENLTTEVFDIIDSTNTEAKRRIVGGNHAPCLLLAEQQTAGRGRLGRSFYSPAQTGLYMTLVLGEPASLAGGTMLTIAAATAAAEAVEAITGVETQVKWVNDLYLQGRKVAGILCEAVTDERGIVTVLAGIGVNIRTEDFPEELLEKAGSLGAVAEREELAAEIACRLLSIWRAPEQSDFLARYRSRSFVPGNRVYFERGGRTFEALAVAIADDGGLVVRYDDGSEETLRNGEVSVKVCDRVF